MATPLTTDEIMQRLATKYSFPDYLFFTEVPFKDEGNSQRLADAIALPTYESRSYEMHIFEVKASRSDWLRELKNGSKALINKADRFWLVIGHADVADVDELPPGWGLMAPYGDGLRIVKQAKALREVRERVPWTRQFLVQLARKAHKNAFDLNVADQRKHFREGEEYARKELSRTDANTAIHAKHMERVIKITSLWFMHGSEEKDFAQLEKVWRAGAALVGQHDYAGPDRLAERLEMVAGELQEHAKKVREACAAVRAPGQEKTA